MAANRDKMALQKITEFVDICLQSKDGKEQRIGSNRCPQIEKNIGKTKSSKSRPLESKNQKPVDYRRRRVKGGKKAEPAEKIGEES